ncbi:hypothetical protein D3C76_1574670 [compost metagenome]
MSVGLPSFSGFQVIQTSESHSRTVGSSFCQAISLTFSASSTQAIRMRAFDLMLSRLWRRPANANQTRRLRVRMNFSPISK